MSSIYLERAVHELPQVDRLLGLSTGTARRWIDGYERRGKAYLPVVREATTGDDLVTWGEFVETRLLSTYRDSGVPMLRMRPNRRGVAREVRGSLSAGYPPAVRQRCPPPRLRPAGAGRTRRQHASGRRGRDEPAGFSSEVRRFESSTEFGTADGDDDEIALRVRPLGRGRAVALDRQRKSGQPVVRSTSTEVLAELVRAGEPIEWVAHQYELTLNQVLDAIEYERRFAEAA